jgi:hypothetical protein
VIRKGELEVAREIPRDSSVGDPVQRLTLTPHDASFRSAPIALRRTRATRRTLF